MVAFVGAGCLLLFVVVLVEAVAAVRELLLFVVVLVEAVAAVRELLLLLFLA